MKKIILTLALAAVAALSANAQIGVGVGYATKNLVNGDNTASYAGFYGGGNYNIELSNGICVAPGIDVSYVSNSGTLATIDYKNTEMYLGIPLHFNYAIEIANGFKLTPFVGPTISFGLSSKHEDEVLGTSDNYGNNSNYGRFDILVGGGVAFDVQDLIRVSFGYNLGLLDRNSSDDVTTKANGLHFGVAYLF